MIVEIDLNPEHPGDARIGLVEPGEFKAFKILLRGAGAHVADGLAALGLERYEEHAWVPVGTLRALAGDAATPAWEESLAGMLEFARSRGWVDEERDAVRAHVERES